MTAVAPAVHEDIQVRRFETASAALEAIAHYEHWLQADAAAKRRSGLPVYDQSYPEQVFCLSPRHPVASPLVLVGGMGPLAGALAFRRACERFGNSREIVLYQACSLPDRTKVILAGGARGEREMVGLLQAAVVRARGFLRNAESFSCILVCNSAHYFLDRLDWGPGARPVSLVERAIGKLPPGRVLVLATAGGRAGRVYSAPLRKAGVEFEEPDPALERRLMAAIYDGIKALDDETALAAGTEFFDELTATRGEFDCILAGCTELPSLIGLMKEHGREVRATVVDPVEAALASVPDNWSVCDLFERQAERRADRVAAGDLTYGALNRQANRIAHAVLSARGRGAEPVALLFGSGTEIIGAMLGVLKSGKFYVPVDASQPQPRIAAILEDAGAPLLVTDSAHADFAASFGVPVLNIDEIPDDVPTGNSGIPVAPGDLAYVLYTSGSTGRPKGVMQTHRYVLHLVQCYADSGAMTHEDRFGLLYSACFAGAVRDIYCALLTGASVVAFDVARDGLGNLAAWLGRERITLFFAVATLFRHFCAVLTGRERFPALRMIQIGSETVYPKDLDLFRANFPRECVLVANLGGSEVSPIRQFFMDRSTRVTTATVPAGYPVEGYEVLLEDGEIVVRSRFLSPGYWGRPELTEQVYSTDPEDPSLRRFRTGDLGRFLPDGCLLHLGRKDFQTKIRGYRVETAEVETAILNTGLVREAAVAGVADRAGEMQLVAWCAGATGSAGALRESLEAVLPSYMIPGRFVFPEALPQTPTGKLDRRALADLLPALPANEYEPPRTETESEVQRAWAAVLGGESIGIHDRFFEIGGNSLRAAQVAARLGVPLRDVFDFPTIASLAERIGSFEFEEGLL